MNKINFIVITTDQQRYDSLGCYGSEFVYTPNLDKLAKNGVLFTRAYCTNPVCTPSRVSIFGGRYVSRHGVWNIGMNVPEDEVLISHRLQRLGYRTHYIGKAHFNSYGGSAEQSKEQLYNKTDLYPDFKGPYYGFETVELALGHGDYGIKGHYGKWAEARLEERGLKIPEARCLAAGTFGGEAYQWDMPLDLTNSMWTAERVVEFLQENSKIDQPFFLGIGFEDPHHPHCLPAEYAIHIDPDRIPEPAYVDGELEDKPVHIKEVHEGKFEHSLMRGSYPMAGQYTGFNYTDVSHEDVRMARAYYYGMVEIIDQSIGKIMDAVNKLGLYENTVVVFTTDHGELLGDHGIWMKGAFHYEQLVRVPLIMQFPEFQYASKKLDGLVSLADIVPTLMACIEQTGEEKSEAHEFDGIDLLPYIRGHTAKAHEHVLVECIDDPCGLRLKTIITGQYKLTCYMGQEYGELYDLVNDTGEVFNLWDCPERQNIKATLLLILLEYSERLEKRPVRQSYA